MEKNVIILKSNIGRQGGLETMAWRYAHGFAQAGAKVTVLSCNAEGIQSDKFDIVNLGKTIKSSLIHFLQFDHWCKQWIHQKKVDVIFGMERNSCLQTHFHAGNGAHAEYLQQRMKRASIYERYRLKFNPKHHLFKKYEKNTFESQHLSTLLAPSAMVKNEILTHYKLDPKKITVCYDTVDIQDSEKPFQTWSQQRDEIRQALSLDLDCLQFLFIGHNFKRKGLKQLLYALSYFNERKFQLSVVGKDKNLQAYISLSNRLGLKNKVKFFGPQKNVYPFYQMADVFILLSTYDPFALVVEEALLMGLYSIVSAKAGAHELLSEEIGSVVDMDKPKQLVKTIESAFSCSKTQQSAQHIRQHIKNIVVRHEIGKSIDYILGKIPELNPS